jgi:hypothetical protein
VKFVGLALAGVAAVLLLAALRPDLDRLLRALIGLPAGVLAEARRIVHMAHDAVRGSTARARHALAYGAETSGVAAAWDVVAPLVYLVLLVVVLGGDVVLASLRFGALLGLPVDELPVDGAVLDLLTGLLFLAVLATFGCVLLDVAHVTPMRRPYGLVEGRARTAVTAAAAAGTVLSAFAGVLFFVWGQYAIFGEPSQDVATLFIAVFAVLLVGASVLAAGGALGCALALWVLLGALAAVVLVVVAALLHLVVTLLDGVCTLAASVVRLLAQPGTMLWNWLVELPLGRALHLHPVVDPVRSQPVSDIREDKGDVDLAGGP